MNDFIISNWNKTVRPDDTVYHLGDVFLGQSSKAKEILQNLNGYKILIRGNHDNKSHNWYSEAGFEEVYNQLILPSPTKPGLYTYILTHIPIPYWQILSLSQEYGTKVINLHGHVHLSKDPAFTGTDIWGHPDSYINFSAEAIHFSPIELNL